MFITLEINSIFVFCLSVSQISSASNRKSVCVGKKICMFMVTRRTVKLKLTVTFTKGYNVILLSIGMYGSVLLPGFFVNKQLLDLLK